ncbi:MAG: lamin tail domain-containing protein [bacterium]
MRLLSTSAFALALFVSAPGFAQSIVDITAAGAVTDGAATDAEYPAHTAGSGGGFGGPLGAATLGVDGDPFGNLTWALYGGTGTCAGDDIVVIYLDTEAGGFASTAPLTDTGDAHRAAISAVGADLTFATGFEADYAIAFNTTFAGLWKLDTTGHTFVKTLSSAAISGCNQELSGMTLADVGLAPGDDFRHVATLINAATAFRSDEFHGATGPGANIGSAAFSLAANEFVTFSSFFVVINEVDSDTPLTDTAEFVELLTRPSADLSALSLTYFNGSNDASYYSTALTTADVNGFFVVGNAAVTPDITHNDNLLQNGADAVALYLGAPVANGSAATATNLVDLVVYDTDDGDDAGLLALFPTPQPQLNESAFGTKDDDSNQRCAGGALNTTYFFTELATPRAANICPTCASDSDCGTCQACDLSVGLCEVVPDNTVCDDGDLCTTTDVCVAGVCGGASTDCSGLDGACAVGTCNASTGACESTPVADDTTCDDGDACTETDVCTAGVCGGAAKDCSGLDGACAAGTCIAGTGACEARSSPTTPPATTATPAPRPTCAPRVCAAVRPRIARGLTVRARWGPGTAGTGAARGCDRRRQHHLRRRATPAPRPTCAPRVVGGVAKDCRASMEWYQACCGNAERARAEAVAVVDGSTCDDGNLAQTPTSARRASAGAAKDCAGLNTDAASVYVTPILESVSPRPSPTAAHATTETPALNQTHAQPAHARGPSGRRGHRLW